MTQIPITQLAMDSRNDNFQKHKYKENGFAHGHTRALFTSKILAIVSYVTILLSFSNFVVVDMKTFTGGGGVGGCVVNEER